MYGDELNPRKGGHLHGVGRAGKSEFPPGWDEDKIADEVVETARSPHSVQERADGTWLVTGVRDGVTVGAYVRPNGTIATGFPIRGPSVKKNPPKRGE